MKVLDLFSGIGGFSYGLEKLGFKTVAFCEIDKFCKLLLQKHWKGIKIYDDVKEITKRQLEADGIELPEIITGGFPCQPFSVAGKQRGTDDNRHLWPQMFRIIRELTPRWVIGENVRGLVNIQDGMVFETVCTDLEGEGYEVRAFNIPAAGVGAPHRRERIWIVGYAQHHGSPSTEKSRSLKETSDNNQEGQIETSEFKRTSRPSNSEAMANAKSQGTRTNDRGLWQGTSGISGRQGTNQDVEDTRRPLRQGSLFEETNENETRQRNADINQRPGRPSRYDVADTNESNSRKRKIFKDLNDEGRRASETRRESLQSKDRQTRTDNLGSSNEDVADSKSLQGNGRGRHEHPSTEQGPQQAGGTSGSMANAYGGRSSQPSDQVQAGWDESGYGSENVNWWESEPDVGRVAHGVSGRVHRLKALGNAIVPQIAEEIGRAILKAEGAK